MVFAKLSVQEKDAFFGLLDEYFQSRPELFGQNGSGQRGVSGLAGTATAASVVHRAFATAGGGNATGSASESAGGASGKSNNPYAGSMPSHADMARVMSAGGRVAAASLAFSGGGPPSQSQSPLQSFMKTQHGPGGTQSGDPPSLPRRTASQVPARASLDRVAGTPGLEVDKLVTKKASVFSALRKSDTVEVAIPPAFVAPKNTYGPPPVRRVTSETSTGTGGGAVGTHSHSHSPREALPESESEVAEGEWAEVLYDYSSEDPGDLAIEAGTRVFVTDKSSDDWWTGQVEGQGRQGLFPASYVKVL